MKPKVKFRIDKRHGNMWDGWDWWFTTERAARRKFDACYRNNGGPAKQVFRIVRVTEEVLPLKAAATKSKQPSVRSNDARTFGRTPK